MVRSIQVRGRSTTILCLLLGLVYSTAAHADQIVRRDNDVENGRVKSFDEDGVVFDNGKTITWDVIDEGTVATAKQADFDKMLKELGEPLFRIKLRLRVGDYEELLEHAEAIYPRYADRRSPTAYIVFQALMWAREAAGQREKAVEPYLRAYEYIRVNGMKDLVLPGTRRLEFDPDTALTPTLQPVWFDKEAAKASLEGVRAAARAMSAPHPDGVYLYYATLALAAEDSRPALEMLKRVEGKHRSAAELKQIVLAHYEVLAGNPASEVKRLAASADSMLPQNQAVAHYWLGLAKTKQAKKETRLEGVLQLLRIPALYGKQSPELAGAGLYHAMNTLKSLEDVKGSLAVRRELQIRYAHTTHAAKLAAASATSKSN